MTWNPISAKTTDINSTNNCLPRVTMASNIPAAHDSHMDDDSDPPNHRPSRQSDTTASPSTSIASSYPHAAFIFTPNRPTRAQILRNTSGTQEPALVIDHSVPIDAVGVETLKILISPLPVSSEFSSGVSKSIVLGCVSLPC